MLMWFYTSVAFCCDYNRAFKTYNRCIPTYNMSLTLDQHLSSGSAVARLFFLWAKLTPLRTKCVITHSQWSPKQKRHTHINKWMLGFQLMTQTEQQSRLYSHPYCGKTNRARATKCWFNTFFSCPISDITRSSFKNKRYCHNIRLSLKLLSWTRSTMSYSLM